jgi:hypothetical protein
VLAVQHFHCGRDAPCRFPDFGDFYISIYLSTFYQQLSLTILNDNIIYIYIMIDGDYVMLSFAKSFD